MYTIFSLSSNLIYNFPNENRIVNRISGLSTLHRGKSYNYFKSISVNFNVWLQGIFFQSRADVLTFIVFITNRDFRQKLFETRSSFGIILISTKKILFGRKINLLMNSYNLNEANAYIWKYLGCTSFSSNCFIINCTYSVNFTSITSLLMGLCLIWCVRTKFSTSSSTGGSLHQTYYKRCTTKWYENIHWPDKVTKLQTSFDQ